MMKREMFLLFTSFACIAAPVRVLAQSAPAGDAAANGPLDLTVLVRQAEERNPEVLAARRAVQVKRAQIPQAGAWADPTLSVSYGGNALPPFTLMRSDPSSAR